FSAFAQLVETECDLDRLRAGNRGERQRGAVRLGIGRKPVEIEGETLHAGRFRQARRDRQRDIDHNLAALATGRANAERAITAERYRLRHRRGARIDAIDKRAWAAE